MSDRSPFSFDSQGNIIGPTGSVFVAAAEQLSPGIVAMSLTLINDLYRLGHLEGMLETFKKASGSAAERIKAAKQDLIDQLGLDPDLIGE